MEQRYYAPASVQELAADLRQLTPQSKIIGGGTDLVIRLNLGLCKPDALLYLGNLKEIGGIEDTGETITIGAMATMAAIAGHPLLRSEFPAICTAAADVGCKQIRNNGTIGGNVGNASAAGDLIPVLFLLRAMVEIASADGSFRVQPIDQVVVGPGKTSLSYQDAIMRFIIPKPKHAGSCNAFAKLGSRKTLTISRIGLAVELERDAAGVIEYAGIVAGAISLTPVHVTTAEEYLVGRTLGMEEIHQVGAALSDLIMEITPEMFDRDYKVGAAYGVAEDALLPLMQEGV